jgi:hypothetical protein
LFFTGIEGDFLGGPLGNGFLSFAD